MNIPFTGVTYADGSWTYTWASGLGTVRVVLWGTLLTTTTGNTYTYTSALYASAEDAPPVEVVLDGELAVSEYNASYLILQWYRVECAYYQVQFKVGSTWTDAGSIHDDPLIWIYTHITPLLEDQTVAVWRVVAFDENQRECDPLAYEYKIVRPPNPPTGAAVSCSGGTLTVE